MKLYCLECDIGPDEDYYCSYINLDYVLCIEMFYNEDKQEKYGLRFIMQNAEKPIEVYYTSHDLLEEEIAAIENLTKYPTKFYGDVNTYPQC